MNRFASTALRSFRPQPLLRFNKMHLPSSQRFSLGEPQSTDPSAQKFSVDALGSVDYDRLTERILGIDRIEARMLKTRVDHTEKGIDRANKRMDEADQRMGEADEWMGETEEIIDEANKRMDRADRRMDEANQRMDRADQKMFAADQQILKEVQGRMEEAEQKRGKVERKVDGLEKSFTLKDGTQGSMGLIERVVMEQNKEIGRLQKRLLELELRMKDGEDAVEVQEDRITIAERALKQQKNRMTVAEITLEEKVGVESIKSLVSS